MTYIPVTLPPTAAEAAEIRAITAMMTQQYITGAVDYSTD